MKLILYKFAQNRIWESLSRIGGTSKWFTQDCEEFGHHMHIETVAKKPVPLLHRYLLGKL